MTTPEHKEKFRIEVKTALLHRNLSVPRLAKLINRPHNSVYRAINHFEFPRIRDQIRQELGLSHE